MQLEVELMSLEKFIFSVRLYYIVVLVICCFSLGSRSPEKTYFDEKAYVHSD